jgi:hypothetical protein
MKKVIMNVLFLLVMVTTAVVPVSAADQVSGELVVASVKGVPEAKTVMEKQCKKVFGKKVCVKVPVLYRRTSTVQLVLVYKADRLDNTIKRLIGECATWGFGASAAVFSETYSAEAASTAFMPAFEGCIKVNATLKALHIKASLKTKQMSDEWKRSS